MYRLSFGAANIVDMISRIDQTRHHNAAGRIDTALLAYRLLTSTDPLEARELAEKLGNLNQHRQELTDETVATAEAQVLAGHRDARLYLAAGEDFASVEASSVVLDPEVPEGAFARPAK